MLRKTNAEPGQPAATRRQPFFARGGPHAFLPGPLVQRQPTPTARMAGPTFSVDRATYLDLVNRAVAGISGPLVEGQTLAGAIRPLLERMAAQAAFRESTGTEHGGGTISHRLPGTPAVTLTLRLVLDDDAAPQQRRGTFHETGAAAGEIKVFIRNNADQETLRNTLFHEALHMMGWIISGQGASRLAGEDPHAVRALTMSRYTVQIAGIRRWLERLADGVNPRRSAAGQAPVTAPQLDEMARWLMDESQVRAETLVFRLFLAAQAAQAAGRRRGPQVTILPSESDAVNDTVVDHYVFDHSTVFTPGDRSGLTADDREILRSLRETLQGFVSLQVRRRFSWTAYGPRGIPRQQVQWQPPPLTP